MNQRTSGCPQHWYDSYTMKARAWPALLAALPVAGVLSLLFPDVEWWRIGVLGTIVGGALVFLLAQIARSAGKSKEPDLFTKWGSKPTTRYLRHRESPLDSRTLGRYHRNITLLDASLEMPSPAHEASDAASADAVYEAASRLLINRTRDTARFPLLFKENTHYGFSRNLWALKPIAIGISVAALVAFTAIASHGYFNTEAVPLAPVVLAILTLAWMALWLSWFTPEWVRVAADAYAERLLEASDDLIRDQTSQAKGRQD